MSKKKEVLKDIHYLLQENEKIIKLYKMSKDLTLLYDLGIVSAEDYETYYNYIEEKIEEERMFKND